MKFSKLDIFSMINLQSTAISCPSKEYQRSPQHTSGILAQYAFGTDSSFDVELGRAKIFDVVAGST